MKKELRKYAKERRATLDLASISAKIVAKIMSMPEFQRAENVLLFHPLKLELNLLALCEGKKKYYLPRIDGDDLLICPYTCGDKLAISKFKTQEPICESISNSKIDFAIIPCLMADKNKYRLGFGKGFYDRLIPKLSPDCVKICPVPESLITENLPHEDFDAKVDFIVSENQIY